MDRNTYSPGLIRDRPGYGLTDPPSGIGGELIPFPVLKLLYRLDKAYIAKKLGVTTEEFEEIIARPNKTPEDYKNSLWLLKTGVFFSRLFGIENRNIR